MQSMTATSTPSQKSSFSLKLALPSISYWESLTEDERRRSINEHKSRKLGRKTGWYPSGCILKRWTEEIYPAVKRIMNDPGNYERLLGNHASEVSRPCRLFMVGSGDQWKAARPTIVAICAKGRIAHKMRDLLRDHQSLKAQNLGFDFMSHKEGTELIAGQLHKNMVAAQEGNMLGLSVLTSTWPPSHDSTWRKSTIGGVITIDSVSYGLTAAHAFYLDKLVEGSVSSESSRDLSEHSSSASWEEDSEASEYVEPPKNGSDKSIFQFPERLHHDLTVAAYKGFKPDLAYANDAVSTVDSAIQPPDSLLNLEVVGTIPPNGLQSSDTSERSLFLSRTLCREMDWALVKLGHSPFRYINQFKASGRLGSPRSISLAPPNGTVVVATADAGLVEAHSFGVIGGIILPGSTEMVDTWTLDSTFSPGDCGAWVLNLGNSNLYGMIIASSCDAQETYFLPSGNIFQSIRSKWHPGAVVAFPAIHPTSFTPLSLSEYDGTDGKPVFLAIKGNVYDVTMAENTYGPGGQLQMLAGRDATRALACQLFTEDMLTKSLEGPVYDCGDLTPSQISNLDVQISTFQYNYPLIGHLDGFQDAKDKKAAEATKKTIPLSHHMRTPGTKITSSPKTKPITADLFDLPAKMGLSKPSEWRDDFHDDSNDDTDNTDIDLGLASTKHGAIHDKASLTS